MRGYIGRVAVRVLYEAYKVSNIPSEAVNSLRRFRRLVQDNGG